MGQISVSGFVVTTSPTASYGGIAISGEMMEQIASQIRSGNTPFTVQHDGRNRMDVKVLGADVRTTENGEAGVWVEIELDEADWDRLGDMRAFSVSVIEEVQKSVETSKPRVSIYADAGRFGDETLAQAQRFLGQEFNVSTGRIFQFSELPPAKVVVELLLQTLQSVGGGVVANWLYETLKSFFLHPKGGGQSQFNIRAWNDKTYVDFHVMTDDPELLRTAIGTIPDLLGESVPNDVNIFENSDRKWTRGRQSR